MNKHILLLVCLSVLSQVNFAFALDPPPASTTLEKCDQYGPKQPSANVEKYEGCYEKAQEEIIKQQTAYDAFKVQRDQTQAQIYKMTGDPSDENSVNLLHDLAAKVAKIKTDDPKNPNYTNYINLQKTLDAENKKFDDLLATKATLDANINTTKANLDAATAYDVPDFKSSIRQFKRANRATDQANQDAANAAAALGDNVAIQKTQNDKLLSGSANHIRKANLKAAQKANASIGSTPASTVVNPIESSTAVANPTTVTSSTTIIPAVDSGFKTKCESYGGSVGDTIFNNKPTCKIGDVSLGYNEVNAILPVFDPKHVKNIKDESLLFTAYQNRKSGANCNPAILADMDTACADLGKSMGEDAQIIQHKSYCVAAKGITDFDKAEPLISAEAYCKGPIVDGKITPLAEKLGITPSSGASNGSSDPIVSNSKSVATGQNTSDCDAAKAEIVRAILKNPKIFAQLNTLAALKMAYRLSSAAPAKKTIEQFVNSGAFKDLKSDAATQATADIAKIYKNNGMSGDAVTVDSIINPKPGTFSYLNSKTRLDNAHSSAMILLLKNQEGTDNKTIPDSLRFDLSDAAAVWAQDKVIADNKADATFADKGASRNLLNFSTQVCQLMKDKACSNGNGGLDKGAITKQANELNDNINKGIQDAAAAAIADKSVNAACFKDASGKTCEATKPILGAQSIADVKNSLCEFVGKSSLTGKDSKAFTIDNSKTKLDSDGFLNITVSNHAI